MVAFWQHDLSRRIAYFAAVFRRFYPKILFTHTALHYYPSIQYTVSLDSLQIRLLVWLMKDYNTRDEYRYLGTYFVIEQPVSLQYDPDK